jgi:hypothetical protein
MANTSHSIWINGVDKSPLMGGRSLVIKGFSAEKVRRMRLPVNAFIGALVEGADTNGIGPPLAQLCVTVTSAFTGIVLNINRKTPGLITHNQYGPLCPSGTAIAAPYVSAAEDMGDVFFPDPGDVFWIRYVGSGAEVNTGTRMEAGNATGMLCVIADETVMAWRWENEMYMAAASANGSWTVVRSVGPTNST